MAKKISYSRIPLFLAVMFCFVWMFTLNVYADGEEYEVVKLDEEKSIIFDESEGEQQQGDSVGYYFVSEHENDYYVEINGSCSDLGLRIDDESGSMNDNPIFTEEEGESSKYWIHCKAGVKYYFKFYIAGFDEIHDVSFVIKKCPINNVKSISYQPASPVQLIENIDIYVKEWDTDDGFECFYAYEPGMIYQDGAELTINDDNGSKQYAFNKANSQFECDGESLFTAYNLNIKDSDDQTPDNIWGIGKHKVTLSYMGASTDVEVEVVETPVASISLDTDSIEYLENTDGWWDEDDQVYYYQTPYTKLFIDGLKLTVTYKDGSVKEYVFSTDEDGREGFRCGDEYIGVYGEGRKLITAKQEQSAENPWKVGGSYPITVSYLGVETTVQAKVVENTVQSINFKPDTIALRENVDGYISSTWDDENEEEIEYFEYEPAMKLFSNGAVLSVTDGVKGIKDYTYNANKRAFDLNYSSRCGNSRQKPHCY